MAFVAVLLAILAMLLSGIYVVQTTDARSMQEERARAAEIAEIISQLPGPEVQAMLLSLGGVAGLHELTVTAKAETDPAHQSIPLLTGAMGGQFLSWHADRPGLWLLTRSVPLRVPMLLAMLGFVLSCLVLMLRQMRRMHSQGAAAQRQALCDHLTGLPNRLALEGELARRAAAGQEFSMLALDLDRFKPVNDLFGHDAGDLALIEVARRLAAQLRPEDFLARVGGDEFVAIVQRGGQRPVLAGLARDCIAAVGQPLLVVGQNVSVGISLGIVEDGASHPAAALLKQADRSLYEAKRLDGGAFCFAGDGRGPREGNVGIETGLLLAAG